MPTTADCQRILAISGSLRTQSSNVALLRSAIALSPDNTSFDIYSGLAFLPHFNPDLDQPPIPQAVADLRCQLRESHAVLISSPEYAHGIPGVLKNALDWIVSSGELYGKPIALFNASPRATFAQAALKETLTVMGARLISQACISVPMAAGELDRQSVLSNSVIVSAIRDALLELVNAATLNSAESSNITWNKSSEKQ